MNATSFLQSAPSEREGGGEEVFAMQTQGACVSERVIQLELRCMTCMTASPLTEMWEKAGRRRFFKRKSANLLRSCSEAV